MEIVDVRIMLDLRYEKKDEKYPCKLRIYPAKGKRKYYLTGHDLTKEEFKKIWETKRPKKEYQEPRLELQTIEYLANSIIKKMDKFSFEEFEQLFLTGKVTKDINFYYERTITNYSKNGQISTATNYRLALKSLQLYAGKDSIQFTEITPQWLQGYEKYMVEDNKKSPTTVSIYIRTLRTVFNDAIAEKAVSPEYYPFGKRKYQPPAPKSVKKALDKEQLRKLFDGQPQTPEQEKAKAFWFFSFAANGMNFKDIAYLRQKDVKPETIEFYRAKTKNTNKDQACITVYRNDIINGTIEKYGTIGPEPNKLVFDIIDVKATPAERHRQLKNFIRYVNQHIKKYALSLEMGKDISTYWARHSWATNSIRNGASMEFVSEALAHSDMKTTMNYFKGFDNKTKKDMSQLAMNF